LQSIDIVKRILKNLDIPYELHDYGVREDLLSLMAENAVSSTERLLKTNPGPISAKDAEEIYRKAY
jgi:alcohol dehydrogenase class IV